jgi:hypothetical protein
MMARSEQSGHRALVDGRDSARFGIRVEHPRSPAASLGSAIFLPAMLTVASTASTEEFFNRLG